MSGLSIERMLAALRRNRNALLIVAITFVIQLLTLRAPVVMGEPYAIALNLLRGLGYSYPTFGHTLPVLTCYIPPLYVWICYAILGLGGKLIAIQLFNLLCLQWAALVLLRFIRNFLNESLALISLALFCLYVPLWIFAAAIEPDALNLLLVILTIDLLYRLATRPTTKRTIYFGLLIGVQLLVRPDIIIGSVLFAVWLFIVLRHRISLSERISILAISGSIALLCVLPWTVRNYLEFHRFVLVSANSGFNFWMGNNASATGEFALRPFDAEEAREAQAVDQFAETHDEVTYDQHYMILGLQWMLHHPEKALLLDLKKIYYHWWMRDSLGDSMGVHDLARYYALASILILLFGLYGIFVLKNKIVRSLLLTLFLYSTAVSVIFFVQSRHRTLKVDPFLLPLAVAGAFALYEKFAFREQTALSSQSEFGLKQRAA